MKNTLKISAITFIFSIGVLAQEIVDETLNTQVAVSYTHLTLPTM